jgi:hypothetical protein
MTFLRKRIALGAAMFAAATASPCTAQVVDLFSPATIHGVVDLRAGAADGETSFTLAEFGKARFGGDGGPGLRGNVEVANATLEWTPRFSWDLSAVVDAVVQPGQELPIDIGQAYLLYKPVPTSSTRFQFRAGLFYPPVSLENDSRAWGVTDTITPSAINSWIGEEVKVVGVEGKVSHDFGDQAISATAGVFSFDDTAGTLLAFRGWAMDDSVGQLNGRYLLPPLSPFIASVQDNESYTTRDIDNRAGLYGRAEWRTPAGITLDAFYYDNRGDNVAVTSDWQWAWSTHFADVGARWDLNDHTWLMGQALEGRTSMGDQSPDGRFADVTFRSAYTLATHTVGKSAFTLRGDLYDTHDNTDGEYGDTSEHGWTLTGAWRYPLSKLFDLRLEAMRVDSTRPSRVLAGETPHQAQTVLQSSLRLSF